MREQKRKGVWKNVWGGSRYRSQRLAKSRDTMFATAVHECAHSYYIYQNVPRNSSREYGSSGSDTKKN